MNERSRISQPATTQQHDVFIQRSIKEQFLMQISIISKQPEMIRQEQMIKYKDDWSEFNGTYRITYDNSCSHYLVYALCSAVCPIAARSYSLRHSVGNGKSRLDDLNLRRSPSNRYTQRRPTSNDDRNDESASFSLSVCLYLCPRRAFLT